MALDYRSFGLAGSVFRAEQVFRIDFELNSLKSSDADDRQEHGYHEKVPGMFGYHVAESVEGFCQPFVNEFYAASHVCEREKKIVIRTIKYDVSIINRIFFIISILNSNKISYILPNGNCLKIQNDEYFRNFN